MAKTSGGQSALSRAVQVLDAFDSASVYLTASQVAGRTGQPISSTHRQLQELVRLGLVDRSPDRTYRLGTKLWEWAARSPGAAGLRAAALPHLQKVHNVVRQHAQIGVLSDNEVLFIERLSAPGAVVNYTVIGQRLPALASSAGLVQVAWLPPDKLEAVLAQGVDQFTPSTMTDQRRIRRRLVDIRRSGYVITSGFIHPAARGVAVPLWGHQKDLLGALSVVVPNDEVPAKPVVELLQEAAEAISRDYAAFTRGQQA